MTEVTPVILCGGSGTRLWPRSREARPKPFLPLIGEHTLFQDTLFRCSGLGDFSSPIVVTGATHLPHVEEQLGERGALILVEPSAKNTAAAIALAALHSPEDAIMLVCPSDHCIGDRQAFATAVGSAAALASDGWLVCFGIEPKSAETGFGYLKFGEEVRNLGFRVAQFIEKPNRSRAEALLAAGGYAWNGGIFAFRAGDYLSELETYRPDLIGAVRRSVENGAKDQHRFYPEPTSFAEVVSESVDFAVMENTKRAALVRADMLWSDIGNWHALYTARRRDGDGNTVIGHADLVDCRNVLVESDGARVSAIGLDNVIIVVDGGEVLVTSASGTQMVGQLPGAARQ